MTEEWRCKLSCALTQGYDEVLDTGERVRVRGCKRRYDE